MKIPLINLIIMDVVDLWVTHPPYHALMKWLIGMHSLNNTDIPPGMMTPRSLLPHFQALKLDPNFVRYTSDFIGRRASRKTC